LTPVDGRGEGTVLVLGKVGRVLDSLQPREGRLEIKTRENSVLFSLSKALYVMFHEARAKESLEAAGAYETVVAPCMRGTGWHLLGTAMNQSAPSVVNPWSRTHDMPNLYVFDGRVWPTSSGMNPTATIVALEGAPDR